MDYMKLLEGEFAFYCWPNYLHDSILMYRFDISKEKIDREWIPTEELFCELLNSYCETSTIGHSAIFHII